MDFIDYLHSKKIDSETFRKADPGQWEEWKRIFDQVHPGSFTAQKLFLINPLRRLYPFKEEVQVLEQQPDKKKPVVKPKPRMEKEAGAEGIQPKPKIKPKVQMKPKMGSKPEVSDSAASGNKVVKSSEKPKVKPRPVIKKPKSD